MSLHQDDVRLLGFLCAHDGIYAGQIAWDAPLWRLVNNGLVHIDWPSNTPQERAIVTVTDEGWRRWQTVSATFTG